MVITFTICYFDSVFLIPLSDFLASVATGGSFLAVWSLLPFVGEGSFLEADKLFLDAIISSFLEVLTSFLSLLCEAFESLIFLSTDLLAFKSTFGYTLVALVFFAGILGADFASFFGTDFDAETFLSSFLAATLATLAAFLAGIIFLDK